MQTKRLKLTLTLSVIFISLFFSSGVFGAWNEPGVTPPDGNLAEPINVGDKYQHRDASLGISNGINFSNMPGNTTTQDLYRIGVNYTLPPITPLIFSNPSYFLWGFDGYDSINPTTAKLSLYKDASSTARLLLRGKLCLNTANDTDCISNFTGLAGSSLWVTTTGNGIRNTNTGYVGIGTPGAPSSTLHVYSTTILSTIFQSASTTGNQSISIRNGASRLMNIGFDKNNNAYIWASSASNKFQIGDEGNPSLLVTGMQGTSTATNIAVGGTNGAFGTNTPKFSIIQTDGLPALMLGNTTNPRMAIRGNSNGSWTAYDYANSAGNSGITQYKGNVGIGTTTPAHTGMHIYSTLSNPEIDLQGRSGANNHWGMYVSTSTNSFNIWGTGASGDNRMTILSDGKVGIGTNSPGAKLDIEASSITNGPVITGIDVSANGPLGNSKIAIYADTNESLVTTNTDAYAGWFNGKLYAYKLCVGGISASDCKTSWPSYTSYWNSNGYDDIYSSNIGNVGIGTTTPNYKLTVVGTTLFKPDATWDGGDNAYLNLGGGGHYIKASYSDRDEFKGYHGIDLTTNSGKKITILDSGNIGIGTTTPIDKLHIEGNVAGAIRTYIRNTNASGYSSFAVGNNNNITIGALFANGSSATDYGGANSLNLINTINTPLALGANNAVAVTILGSGRVGIGTSSPSGLFHVSGLDTSGAGIAQIIENTNTATTNNWAGIYLKVKGRDYGSIWGGVRDPNSGIVQGLTLSAGNNTDDIGFLVGNSSPGVTPVIIKSTGKVGIGTSSPVELLDVYGNINISSGSAYKYNGVNMVIASTTLNNYFFGNSGNLTMTGGKNVGIGFQSLNKNTSGYENVATGYQSLYNNTSGYRNTANGYSALYSNTGGHENTAVGYFSLNKNDSGNFNTAMGHGALNDSGYGHYNTAIGAYAGYGVGNNENSHKDRYSTFIGYKASRDSSISYLDIYDNMTAIGYNAKVGASNSLVLGGIGADAVKVGIGTSTPWTLFNIYSTSSGPIINLEGTPTNYRGLRVANLSNAENWFMGANTSSNFVIRRGGSNDDITIDSGNGNVGIGVTVPGQKLEVNGGIRINTTTARPTCDSTTRGTFWFAQGGTGVKDSVDVCAKGSGGLYTWRTIY